jgi:hypothetical protein
MVYAAVATVLALGTAGEIWRRDHARLSAELEDAEASRMAMGHKALLKRTEPTSQAPSVTLAKPAPPPPSPAAVSPVAATPAVDVVALEGKLNEAIAAMDAEAFFDVTLALLDAGEAAYPALIKIMTEMQVYPMTRGWLAGNQAAFRKFHNGLMIRASRLGGLVDAVLAREGDPDGATAFAFAMLQSGSKTKMPKERQSALLVTMIGQGTGDGGIQDTFRIPEYVKMLQGLGTLEEVLPTLEKLAVDPSVQGGTGLINAIASMDRAQAAGSLLHILRNDDPEIRRRVFSCLWEQKKSKERNALLWEMLNRVQSNEDAHGVLMGLLADYPENMDRMVQCARELQPSDMTRRNILSGIAQNGLHGSKAQKQAVWDLYESEPTMRDDLLQTMCGSGDAKAKEVLVQRIQTGQIPERFAHHIASGNIDYKTVRENADAYKRLAANPVNSVVVRTCAFTALYCADRSAALNSLNTLMTGFPQLPEKDRMDMVRYLSRMRNDPETAPVLNEIAASDPSEEVRQVAAGQGD